MAYHPLSKYIENTRYVPIDTLSLNFPYAVQSPGTHILNDKSRVYVTPSGKAYRYALNNTPVEFGNFKLFLRATRLRPIPRSKNWLTVGDALNTQTRDKDYTRKYKQHLLKQRLRGHLTYAGFWEYHPEIFDLIMKTPMHLLLRWNTPDAKKYGPHYNTVTNTVHVTDTPYTLRGVSVVSKKPVTPNSGTFFTGLQSGAIGSAIGHLLNHWIHFGGLTAIPYALDFGRKRYGLAGSPSGKLRPDLLYMTALNPDLVQAVDPYSQDAILIMQMNSAYTRGKYALLQLLKKYPNAKAFRQFDPAKLLQIQKFPQFIDLDNDGLLQFRRLMQFWQLNPELALMLGTLALRAVSSYNELRNAQRKLGVPVDSGHAPDADRQRIQKALDIFLSYRHLGANDKKQVMDYLHSKYGNESLAV